MTIPRRSILARAAALLGLALAPVAALCAPRKRRHKDEVAHIWPGERVTARSGERIEAADGEAIYMRMKEQLREARALLAEAREELGHPMVADGMAFTYPEREELLAKIDAALGRGAGREG